MSLVVRLRGQGTRMLGAFVAHTAFAQTVSGCKMFLMLSFIDPLLPSSKGNGPAMPRTAKRSSIPHLGAQGALSRP